MSYFRGAGIHEQVTIQGRINNSTQLHQSGKENVWFISSANLLLYE